MKKKQQHILIGTVLAAGAATAALSTISWRLSKQAFDRRPRTLEHDQRDGERLGDDYVESIDWYRGLITGEDVSVTSRDGLVLRGTILTPMENSHRWAVCVHGYVGNRETMAAYAKHYLSKGYSVLLPDLRAHGESDGNRMTMSAKDGMDLVTWCQFLVKRDEGASIVLHGVSMGASAVLSATGRKLPRAVTAAISDSAFSTLDEECRNISRKWHMPYWLLRAPFNVTTRIRSGFWLRDAEPVRWVRKSTTPTLFIHSGDDTVVNPEMLPALYVACAAKKEWFVMPDCGHIAAAFRDPEMYWQRVDDFIARAETKENEAHAES